MKFLLMILISYQGALAFASNFSSVKVQTGDTVISLMREYGFTQSQRQSILRKSASLRQAVLTTDMNFLIQKSPRRFELKIYDSRTSKAWLLVRQGGKANVTEINPQFQTQIKKISGTVNGSIYASIYKKTNSHWMASRFQDAFVIGKVKSLQVQAGAKYALTYEKKFAHGQFVKYGEILSAEVKNAGKTVAKNFFKVGRGGLFLHEDDFDLAREYYAPVDYIRISSHFQPARRHPITRRVQPHMGVDFELPTGEPVYAAKAGTIVRFGYQHAAGNFVVIRHRGRVETSYNHLHSISRDLRIGMRVSGGQKIGTIGCTGYCTKAHLHFALRKNGRMVNPLPYINPYPVFAKTILQRRVANN